MCRGRGCSLPSTGPPTPRSTWCRPALPGGGQDRAAGGLGIAPPGGLLGLRLTPRDATPRRFPRLLATALASLSPAPATRTVIIDDADTLTDPAALDVLDRLIQGTRPHPHPRLRLVLSGRSDPRLPLHRYRLAGQVREFRGDDLAMTAQETRELLAAHDVRLTASELETLLARTEGWTAGIRLLAMRMQAGADPAQCVSELAVNRGSPGEYLLAEVLEAQPEPMRRLLVETSFLDELTGPLADAVTGLDGCADMLAGLARRNSFVIAINAAGTRFRKHRLFGELLREQLPRQATRDLPDLMTRAAACFERDGDATRALHWAVRAGDRRHAVTLLARGGGARVREPLRTAVRRPEQHFRPHRRYTRHS